MLTMFAGCEVVSVDGVPYRKGFVPSSDQAWLVELMVQRLELRANGSWRRFNTKHLTTDSAREARNIAELVALGERTGVRGVNVEEFFQAQNAASDTLEAWLFKEWAAGKELPNVSPELLVRDLQSQLNTINGGIVATLAVVGDTMYSSEYRKWARQRLSERKIRPQAAKIATMPFAAR